MQKIVHWVSADRIECAVELIQKTHRGSPASLCLPITSRLGFFEGSRMDSQRLDAQRPRRLRRRWRATLHGMSSTAPLSIC
jgi:hypothetical protein